MNATADFHCLLTYRYRCSACDAEQTVDYALARGYQLPRPSLPNDWREFAGAPICPRHRVEVFIDGVRTLHFGS